MSTTLRRAVLEDAETLSALGARTFSETFAHLYPPQDLETFLAYAYGLERTRADLAHPDKATWILELDSQAIGYALAGPCDLPHPDVASDHGELKRIYVLKDHQGGGRGSLLLNTALDWLEKDGPRPLWIGVWSENHGAQRLYGRMGFEKVGEYFFPVGEIRDLEFILRRG
ncbi:GNAT family N-acetyltransferase [Caulobacter endophyticus]|uniref:GNAT family N-acetyltransferase n=1 Tax=Caulobacter endophyticus TaxID=2172652 RepID=A0A2T9JSM6_9CAUL|nr:GNAT family N-acetyltransferase [Caulobacter endophyticus]PVM86722.1 GNAT family N-acetyltransferase [Caulobacter endophyticus]